jgi:hypothetical protein
MKYCKKIMRRNKPIDQIQKDKRQESSISGVPICGANLSTPVIDQVNYIDEIHYKIGERLYIENAD